MRKDDEIRLRHMLEAAHEAESFARGRTRADLDIDRQLVLSMGKDVEIVGEAATRITESTREQLPTIPWEEVDYVEAGNRRTRTGDLQSHC